MPSIASDTISARVPFEYKNALDYEARQRGVTTSKVLGEVVAEWYNRGHQEESSREGEPTELYGIVLTLVDDLVREGYPESEIKGIFTNIRNEKL